jgi:hypothetical protein
MRALGTHINSFLFNQRWRVSCRLSDHEAKWFRAISTRPSRYFHECAFHSLRGIASQDSCNCFFIFVSEGTKEGSHPFIPGGSEGPLQENVRWGTNSFISLFPKTS